MRFDVVKCEKCRLRKVIPSLHRVERGLTPALPATL